MMRWLIDSTRQVLGAGLIVFMLTPQAGQAQSADEYRQAILGLADLIVQISAHNERSDQLASIELAVGRLEQVPDEVLLQTIGQSVPIEDISRQLASLQAELNRAMRVSHPDDQRADTRSDGIEIPEVTVDPSFCDYATGTISVIELAAWKVLKQIFAATEFTCLQTVAGTNLAAACASIAVLTVSAELSYKNAEFCLNEQRAAKGEAILDLERNIGVYLNTYIDDTTLSSRATQDSIDTLQSDITTTMTSINTVQDDLDNGFSTIDADLTETLDDLSTLTGEAIDLIAQTSDIQFRIQANQVDIEDVQTRTADLEESTEEIRTDTQAIISTVTALQSASGELLSTLQDGFMQVNQDAIAAALANPAFGVAEYALPEQAGGQLESAREVLIQAILALDGLGLGNTSTARALLAQGDLAYNQQNYVSAYRFFAQAYQSLAVVKGAR